MNKISKLRIARPKSVPQGDSGFVVDIKALRKRAHKRSRDGAITPGDDLDREVAVGALNAALATELVCVLRFRQQQFVATGINADPIAQAFLVHAEEELGHADRIARRIIQLGGNPAFAPETLAARGHAEYVDRSSLEAMIHENLVAKCIAIERLREMIRFFAERNPTTRSMPERILATGEEYAGEPAGLLN